jgi:predicted protein tyrosine phosphatase
MPMDWVRFIDRRTLLVNDFRQVNPRYGARLESAVKRQGFNVIRFPYEPNETPGRDPDIPSAIGVYINFLHVDRLVLCPVFGLESDERALRLLEQVFSTVRVIPVDCVELAEEGCVLNCVTWAIKMAGRFMKFLVTDRSGIEAGVLVRSSYIVISIHDTYSPPARVKKQSGLRGLIQLAFDDAEPTDGAELAAALTLMTAEQADQIWKFFEQHKGEVGSVLVHCEAGVSRSPAVAAALCKGTGGDDRKFFRRYQPNMHVYRLMLQIGRARTV